MTTNAESRNSSYSAVLAYDSSRLQSRTTARFCLLNVAPQSAFLDKALGYLSIVTASALTSVLTFGTIALVPSIAATKLLGYTNYFNPGSSSFRNVSTVGKGSVTAIKTLSARAQCSKMQAGGPDHLAPIFMAHTSLFGAGIPGSALFSQFYLLLARWNFYLTGRIYADQLASAMDSYLGFSFPIGETALLQVRTCWLDDCVETFVRNNSIVDRISVQSEKEVVCNVVILGAGYDSRCYRLNLSDSGVATYEVDAPGTQTEKLRVLRDSKTETGDTVFVSCDFESEDWLECLKINGFNSHKPTFIVWEGVTMYLDREVVEATISKVAELGKGSCIGFDYMDASWALSPTLVNMSKKGGEQWKFGMESSESDYGVNKFVAECNNMTSPKQCQGELRVLDHLRHNELIHRYLPKHYDGHPYGHLGDFGGLLLIGTE